MVEKKRLPKLAGEVESESRFKAREV